MASVVVPPHPGLAFPLGALATDFRRDYVRTVGTPVDRVSMAGLRELVKDLRSRAIAELRAEGIPPSGEFAEVVMVVDFDRLASPLRRARRCGCLPSTFDPSARRGSGRDRAEAGPVGPLLQAAHPSTVR